MKRKRRCLALFALVICGILGFGRIAPSRVYLFEGPVRRFSRDKAEDQMGAAECGLAIPRIQVEHDQDGDGILDLDDILDGARKDAANRPKYIDAYYRGGYPPDHEGVCTDVIWRSFRNAGYELKDMVDKDIRANPRAYPRVDRPDPNIDFRRVLNLHPFFRRHALSLTIEVVPHDIDNLSQWQGGDIVIFGAPYHHIAVVSDRRRVDGVPYIIHNRSPFTMEEDALLHWHKYVSPIVGHYRWKP